ncbi:YdbL family protein [Asticcacaulis sp. BYS171W]|uniref:YdbL family protein n=1 Tax=Asticcacaulis aquaticus TaxID=2984212 RepID=A0ABT5HXI6_9CAUL|nr:YdbL family protein [Asticcacaulis aquaticus]MDC7684754.1 YdbL family protein [Asticcacaulis aquaticus]
MKKTLFSILSAVVVSSAVLTSAVVLNTPAYAQSAAKATVDAAKAAGTVGEQSDGYLGLVKGSADGATKDAVDEINAGRAKVYAEAAAKNGVSPAAAGASAFTNIILPKVKAGEFYKDDSGSWKQK